VYESYGNNDDQAEINRCGETWPGRERSHIVFLVQVASPGEGPLKALSGVEYVSINKLSILGSSLDTVWRVCTT
jgi:hypothetical protein